MDNSGNFVIAWQVTASAGNRDIYMRRYNSSGTALDSAPVAVAATSLDEYYPRVAVDRALGDIAVAYLGSDAASGYVTPYVRFYHSDGSNFTTALSSVALGTGLPALAPDVTFVNGQMIAAWPQFNYTSQTYVADVASIYPYYGSSATLTTMPVTLIPSSNASGAGMAQALPDVTIAHSGDNYVVYCDQFNGTSHTLVTYGSNNGVSGLANPTTITTSSAGDAWAAPVIGVNTTGNFVEGYYNTWAGANATVNAQLLTAVQTPSKLGVFANGAWYLDTNGDGTYTAADGSPLSFNVSGGTPVVGDWNGDGKTEIGMYKNGTWWLDTNGDGVLDTGDAVFIFGFSGSSVIPVVGDWNGGGKTEVGVYSNGAWFRDYDGSHNWDATNQAHLAYLGWAPVGSQTVIPVPGDWNGGGKDLMGVYSNGVWFRDTTGSNQWDGTHAYWGWNTPSLIPVVGDWNNSGVDELGVYNQGVWYRDYDGTHTWDTTNQNATEYLGWSARCRWWATGSTRP